MHKQTNEMALKASLKRVPVERMDANFEYKLIEKLSSLSPAKQKNSENFSDVLVFVKTRKFIVSLLMVSALVALVQVQREIASQQEINELSKVNALSIVTLSTL